MTEFPFLNDQQHGLVLAAAIAAGLEGPHLYVTVGFDGEVRVHTEDQPGWSINFVHVYVRGRNLGRVFGTFLTSTPNLDAPSPGVYTF